MKMRTLSKMVHWALLLIAVVFLISGLGISYFRVVETITFGFLSKNVAFMIHESLWIPFTVLLALHLFLTKSRKKIKKF